MAVPQKSARAAGAGFLDSARKIAGVPKGGRPPSGSSPARRRRKMQPGQIEGVETVLRNWAGNAVSDPSVVIQPQSAKQLGQIVRNPKQFPSPVRAVGANMSPNRCAVVDNGTFIDTRKLDRILKLDNDSVTVQAGVVYKNLVRRLHTEGLQLPVDVDFENFTMGSAACGHIHGLSSPGDSSLLSSHVTSMIMVTPTGRELTVTEAKPDLLRIARSSFGLMGVVLEATYRIKPLEHKFVELSRMSLDDFVGCFPEIAGSGEPMRFYMYPFRGEIILEKWKLVTNYPPRRDRLWKLFNWLDVNAIPALAFVLGKGCPISKLRHGLLDSAALGVHRARMKFTNHLGVGYKAFVRPYTARPSCLTRFNYSAWAFPALSYDIVLDAYFRFCHEYYSIHGYRNDLPTVGCHLEHDTGSFLSPAMSGPVFTIEPAASDLSGWDDFLIDFNEFCSQHGGVPFFNQTSALTPQQARASFGDRLNSFRLLRQKVDPSHRLANRFFLELLK